MANYSDILGSVGEVSGAPVGGWVPEGTPQEATAGTETEFNFTGLSAANGEWYMAVINFETSSDTGLQVYFNDDEVEANYDSVVHYIGPGSNDSTNAYNTAETVYCYGATGGGPSHAIFYFHLMADCAHCFWKGMYIDSSATDAVAASSGSLLRAPDTTDINSIKFKILSGTFDVGSRVSLYKLDETGSSGNGEGSDGSGSETILARKELANVSLSGGSVDINNIDQTYDKLYLVLKGRTNQSTARTTLKIFFNDDTTDSNYNRQILAYSNGSLNNSSGSSTSQWMQLAGQTALGANNGTVLEIESYANNTDTKSIFARVSIGESTSSSYLAFASGSWNNTNAITKITVSADAQTFTEGTAQLIGEKEVRVGDRGDTSLIISEQTGTAYTLSLSDAGQDKLLRLNDSAAITLTIPTNASVAFPIGSVIPLQQIGAGQITITPDSGVSAIQSADSANKTRVQYSFATLVKTDTDTWTLTGDIVA